MFGQGILSTLQALWRVLCLIANISPLHLITWWPWAGTNFTIDPIDGSVVYTPSIWDRMAQILQSDSSHKRKLLEWAHSQIPGQFVNNLSSSWSDGVALCALMDAVCPGSCPRYDLLKPTHKVNNCRLGLKLATKHLGIPQTIISAEEMALNGQHREPKLCQLLSLIKWASTQKKHIQKDEDAQTLLSLSGPKARLGLLEGKSTCIVKGSGLLVGLVNKRSKFDIFAPANELLDLQIEIHGPNRELCCERIMSLFPGRNPSVSMPAHGDEKAVMLWQTGTSKLLGTNGPTQVVYPKESSSTPGPVSDALKIPFDYKCVGEGLIQMSYIPRSQGMFSVIVLWQGKHVKGSPFSVTVADTIENLNTMTQGRMRNRRMSVDQGKTALSEVKLPVVSLATPTEELEASPAIPATEPETPCGVTAAVLNRTSKVQRSISRVSNTNTKLPKQATVTRRRILKRIITTAGQEIIIQMAPPTPCPSRESSQDNDSFSSDSASRSSPKLKDSHRKKKEYNKCFDFEITYDSDTSGASRHPVSLTKVMDVMDPRELHVVVSNILEALLQDVFRIVDNKQRERLLQAARRPSDLKLQIHKPLVHTNSALTNGLGIPTNDVRFKCSPFTEGQEAPRKPTLQSDSEDSSSSGHRKLCSTNSYPTGLLQRRFEKLDKTLFQESDRQESMSTKFVKQRSNSMDVNKSFNVLKTHSENKIQGERDQVEIQQADLFMSEIESSVTSATETDSDSTKDKFELAKRPLNKQVKTPLVSVRTEMRITGLKKSKPETKQQEDKQVESWVLEKKEFVTRTNSVPLSNKTEKNGKNVLEHSETLPEETHTGQEAEGRKFGQSGPRRNQSSGQLSSLSSCMSMEDFNYALDAHMKSHKSSLINNQNNLRLSISLPTLSRNWTAFEIDPDETLTIEEMEALSVAAQHRPKRATLGAGDLNDSIHEFNTFDPNRASDFAIENMGKVQVVREPQMMNNGDLHKDKCPVSLMDTLGIDNMSPAYPSPMVSPFSSPTSSKYGSRRNSASKGEMNFGLQKVAEEGSLEVEQINLSAETVKAMCSNIKSEYVPGKGVGVWDTPSQKHSNTVERLKLPSAGFFGGIFVPKATVDRCCQVTYREIQSATGWKKPAQYVRPRPQIVHENQVKLVSSKESTSSDLKHEKKARPLPRIVCNLESKSQNSPYVNHSSSPSSEEARKHLHPYNDRNQGAGDGPQRQSTIDTVDSGIVEDNHSPRQSAPPSPAPPRIAMRPCFINGHRAVTRSKYKGKIALDPKLVSAGTPSPGDESLQGRHKGWSFLQFNRSNLKTKRNHLLLRDETNSASEGDAKPTGRRRHGYHGGCYKRRVTFSRRVLMYRRSSSRSKNSGSKEDNVTSTSEATRSSNIPEPNSCKKENQPSMATTRRQLFTNNNWESQSRDNPDSVEINKSIKPRLPSYTLKGINKNLPPDANKLEQNCLDVSRASSGVLSDISNGLNSVNIKPLSLSPNSFYSKVDTDSNTPTGQFGYGKQLEYKSTESFENFGVSNIMRKELLQELSAFSQLAQPKTKSVIKEKSPMSSEKTVDHLLSVDSVYESDTSCEVARFMSKISDPTPTQRILTETLQELQNIIPLDSCPTEVGQANYKSPTCDDSWDPLGILSQVSNTDKEQEVSHVDLDALDQDSEAQPSDIGDSYYLEQRGSLPDPFCCQAHGTGLRFGKVGMKNNFQVVTKTKGNGGLNVSITGPRPRTVHETAVTYTGDNIYEVLYEVSQPGYYIINVKWSDYNIPESPFICKVTY